MPILPYDVISTWYYLVDNFGTNPLPRLFESWSETQTQDVAVKPMLQGDNGTHVMDVGGMYYTTVIDSPVLIVESATGEQITDAFDVLAEAFAAVRHPALFTHDASNAPVYDLQEYPLLETATLTFGETEVKVDMTLLSAKSSIWVPVLGPGQDFIARLARFYDIKLSVGAGLASTYQIIDGTITIKVNVKKQYFVGTTQAPWFAVTGYTVSGSLRVLAYPDDANLQIAPQLPSSFGVVGYSNTALQIGNIILNFGEANLNSSIERSLKPGEPTTINMKFECFARYTTGLGTNA